MTQLQKPMMGFFKYRAVYNCHGDLLTVMGVRLWWSWPELVSGASYGKTRLFYHP